MKISSIIIAKNEESNITRCIESQLTCIDDIVVLVDSSTTDGTMKILKSFENVNAEYVDWQGFAKTKTIALNKTANDWVFWIDADESISVELQQELNEIKRQDIHSVSAFKVARKAYFLGKWIKHSGWYPGFVLRLFNKKKARFAEKSVHEHLVVDGEIGKLKNDINHFTDPNIFHYFEKFNRYTSLAAEEMELSRKLSTNFDIIIRPLSIFIKMYILKRGFLDGLHGFVLAIFSSVYVFVKYLKLWEINRSKENYRC